MGRDSFDAFAVRAVSGLAEDLRRLFDIVDDPDLDESLRRMTAGFAAYAMSPGDILPDSMGLLGHLDDAILYRLLLDRIRKEAPDVADAQTSRNPDIWEPLAEDLLAVQEFVGEDVYRWLYDRVADLPAIVHKGRPVMGLDLDSEDSAWLRNELEGSLLRLEVKQDAMRREVRKADAILPRLRQRMEAHNRGRK